MNSKRKSRDIEYMRRACLLCDKSPCEVKTGALAVLNCKVLIESWNKLLNTGEVVHAEAELIKQAVGGRVSLKNATLYVTRFPCENCAKLIFEAGIKKVFYMSDHFTSGNSAAPFLEKNGIEVTRIKEEKIWGAN